MEIRPIKPEQHSTRSDYCFYVQKGLQQGRKRGGAPGGTQQLVNNGYKTGRAAFDDNGKMCSCFDLIPYRMIFDGSEAKMGKDRRCRLTSGRKGKEVIRNIFEYAMNEMYEDGYIFSYLYPFARLLQKIRLNST